MLLKRKALDELFLAQGARVLSRQSIWKMIKQVVKKAGIENVALVTLPVEEEENGPDRH